MNQNFIKMLKKEIPADLRIDNVKIVDVFSGRIIEDSVCVGNGKILHIGQLEAKKVFDGEGQYLLPGFIDSHVHIESSLVSPGRYAEMVLPFGTTTVIADPHEIANVKGIEGIRYMMEASAPLPLSIRFMLPSCVPCLPIEDAGSTLSAEDLLPLLKEAQISGLGEMMNVPGVLNEDPDVMNKIENTLRYNKIVDGHAPQLNGLSLDFYSASGVKTDHECSTPQEALDRLERGMYVLLRFGSAAQDLLRLAPAINDYNWRYCLLCTDDMKVYDIFRSGHINFHLAMLVEKNIPPIRAICMATINAAECYGLKDRGAIAPGRRADLVLCKDLDNFEVTATWTQGKLVTLSGTMLHCCEKFPPDTVRSSVHIASLPQNPFFVFVPSGKARCIGLNRHSLITSCKAIKVNTTESGEVLLKDNPGLLKIAVLERHHSTGKYSTAFLDPIYGLKGGAIATTIAHDSHNIVVVGDNEEDMLCAVKEIEKMEGGIVMIANGSVLAELPLPIAGLMSEAPLNQVCIKLEELMEITETHYHVWEGAEAYMTLSFMALPVIPSLKITAGGLFDVDKFAFVSVDYPEAEI